MQALFATVYTTIVYFLTEQPPETSRYLKTVLVYVLCTVAADGFGILLGTLVNPVVNFTLYDFERSKYSNLFFFCFHRMAHSSVRFCHAT